jgi:hypothetical protein
MRRSRIRLSSMLQIASQRSFSTAAVFSKWPEFLVTFGTWKFSDSMLFVVKITRRGCGGKARNGVKRSQVSRDCRSVWVRMRPLRIHMGVHAGRKSGADLRSLPNARACPSSFRSRHARFPPFG